MPATAGPISRAESTMEEFSAMAFPRSSRRSIISTTKAGRDGVSKELTMPWNHTRPTISQIVIAPPSASAARANDCSIERICVITRVP